MIEHVRGGMEGVKKSGESVEHSLTRAFGMSTKAIAGTALAISAVATGAAFEFAEHAEKFETAIRQAGVASHATAEEMEGLSRVALNKSMDSLRASSIGVAETLKELALEGMDASDATKALDGTLRLVKISMGAFGARDAAGIVNDTLGEFGMRADQAGELVDKLAFTMKHFGFRAEELRGTMSALASGAQLTGASLDDTLIGVGLIKTVFPSATKAASAMNAAMQQLASTRAQKELRGIGIVTHDATGKILPLVEILDQLARKTAHMTEAQVAHKLETIAGGRAAGGLSAIMDGLRKGVKDASGNILTGAAAVEFLRNEIAHTQGTAKKMAEMLGDDLGGAITALRAAVSNAGVVLGSTFIEPFKHGIQMANLFVRGMTQLFAQGGFSGEVKEALDKRLGIKDFVVGLFIWIKRIQNFFSELGAGFTKAFAPFRPIVDSLLEAFSQLGQLLGITGQSAAQNADTWDSFGAVGGHVGEILANLAGVIVGVLKGAMDILNASVAVARELWDALRPAILNVWQVLSGVFNMIGGLLTGNWKTMWDGFVDTVVGAARAVIGVVLAMVKQLTKIVDGVAGAFGADTGLTGKLQAFQTQLNDGVLGGTTVLKSFVSSPSVQPAAAAVAQTQAAHAAAMVAGTTKKGEDQHLHAEFNLHVDGEKIYTAHVHAKRDADSRSFLPVASTG